MLAAQIHQIHHIHLGYTWDKPPDTPRITPDTPWINPGLGVNRAADGHQPSAGARIRNPDTPDTAQIQWIQPRYTGIPQIHPWIHPGYTLDTNQIHLRYLGPKRLAHV